MYTAQILICIRVKCRWITSMSIIRMQGHYNKDTDSEDSPSANNLWPCGRLLACKCTFGPGLCHGMGRFATADKNGKDARSLSSWNSQKFLLCNSESFAVPGASFLERRKDVPGAWSTDMFWVLARAIRTLSVNLWSSLLSFFCPDCLFPICFGRWLCFQQGFVNVDTL